MTVLALFGLVALVSAGSSLDSYKDQFCTDPRTMQKHQVYTEWADAYSCTRHRCQPGGRNLAIYTVGCKRVEPPESAVECEEVVEDTNMQFPYCCVRLRCLVLVRGEVWTRVLGQPWETLPAAPWSHMYKMKRPPPGDTTFLTKSPTQGPVYELHSEAEGEQDKVLRVNKKAKEADCNDVASRIMPTPDIVIALSTDNDGKAKQNAKRTRNKASLQQESYEDLQHDEGVIDAIENEDSDKLEVPADQWNDDDNPEMRQNEKTALPETDPPDLSTVGEELSIDNNPTKLQDLVDAIGNRMKDIENVVQRMTEKVNQGTSFSMEKSSVDNEPQTHPQHKRRTSKDRKKPNNDDHYKRGTQYVHMTDSPTEPPLFVDDNNGYYSDASNVMRRNNPPKEPRATYMAPVDNIRKSTHILTTDNTDDKKHKRHSHKKKGKGKNHRKHHNEDKKKHLNRNSAELYKNAVSLDDSSALAG